MTTSQMFLNLSKEDYAESLASVHTRKGITQAIQQEDGTTVAIRNLGKTHKPFQRTLKYADQVAETFAKRHQLIARLQAKLAHKKHLELLTETA